MSLIRPEAAAALSRWHEALCGGAVLLLGGYWIFGSYGLLYLLGYPVALLGFILIWAGVQRGRFRSHTQGVGLVQVDEGQIVYMGPLSGGGMALADLERLRLIRSAKPAHWCLEARGQNDLLIPVDASGSDALFDAFATLPGLHTQHMLTALHSSQEQAIVIWQRRALRPIDATLH